MASNESNESLLASNARVAAPWTDELSTRMAVSFGAPVSEPVYNAMTELMSGLAILWDDASPTLRVDFVTRQSAWKRLVLSQCRAFATLLGCRGTDAVAQDAVVAALAAWRVFPPTVAQVASALGRPTPRSKRPRGGSITAAAAVSAAAGGGTHASGSEYVGPSPSEMTLLNSATAAALASATAHAPLVAASGGAPPGLFDSPCAPPNPFPAFTFGGHSTTPFNFSPPPADGRQNAFSSLFPPFVPLQSLLPPGASFAAHGRPVVPPVSVSPTTAASPLPPCAPPSTGDDAAAAASARFNSMADSLARMMAHFGAMTTPPPPTPKLQVPSTTAAGYALARRHTPHDVPWLTMVNHG